MAQVKFTKTELRHQQQRLQQFCRYLPTLQLKKALLQAQIVQAKEVALNARRAFEALAQRGADNERLLDEEIYIDVRKLALPESVEKEYENIAGVSLPFLKGIFFAPVDYPLYDTPLWLDAFLQLMRSTERAKVSWQIAQERLLASEEELKVVTTRVNLFEKILIPRTEATIKKIRIFLGDQQLAAVCRAKVAKGKILEKKMSLTENSEVFYAS